VAADARGGPAPAGPAARPGRSAAGAARASTPDRARRLLVLLALLLLVTTAASLLLNLRASAQRHEQVALATGRAIFQQVALTRSWNAGHGGVYVPVTADTPPNPFLDDPARDQLTTDGLRLTKINPSYMTRQLSERLQRAGGTQLHLTSLRPIRPENQPDPWERAALEAFERGAAESSTVAGSGEGALLRYMAPLKTGDDCLPCHARQGYRAGDVRGGISVSLPYAPFLRSLHASYRAVVGVHALFLALGLGLIAVLGRVLLARIRELQRSLDQVRTLEGLLPICAGCKRIRKPGAEPRDQASWETFEVYIHDRTDATFTHGLCPECLREYFGDLPQR
jgi:two-component system NtrC family sensor kinase